MAWTSTGSGGTVSLVATNLTATQGNTGLTINGQNIVEFDAMCQAAWDQYKVPFDRILMSSTDIISGMGGFFNSSNTTDYRFVAQADAMAGRIQLSPFVTHTMPLTDINHAFDLMHDGKSIRSVVQY